MPMTVEREKLARNILALADEEVSAVAAFVHDLREDEPSLSDDELAQMAKFDEDITAGRLTPWKNARRRLEVGITRISLSPRVVTPTSKAPARGAFFITLSGERRRRMHSFRSMNRRRELNRFSDRRFFEKRPAEKLVKMRRRALLPE